MTMTLDEVRKTRFHMSRRNGYEVTDVDIFVDKVEATLVQLTEQNDHLRRQLDAVQSSDGPVDYNEVDRLRAEIERLGHASEQASGLAQENERLRAELDQARTSQGANEGVLQENQRLQQIIDSHAGQSGELEKLQQENERLRAHVEDLQSRPTSFDSNEAAPVAAVATALPLRVTTAPEASSAVVRLVQLATEQAESLVTEARSEAAHHLAEARGQAERTVRDAEAHARQVTEGANAEAARVTEESQVEAQRRLDEAAQRAHEMTTDARTKADRVESEARVNAERLTQDAQSRADNLDREVADRRTKLFADLETQRDELVGKVQHLNDFEGSFRTTMADYLRQQVAHLEGKVFQGEHKPALLTEAPAADSSSTPRLDALLHEN